MRIGFHFLIHTCLIHLNCKFSDTSYVERDSYTLKYRFRCCRAIFAVLTLGVLIFFNPTHLTSQQDAFVQQEESRSITELLFSDWSVEFVGGWGAYNGNIRRYEVNHPFPPRGFMFSATFSRPLLSYVDGYLQLKGRIGIDWYSHNSETFPDNRVIDRAGRTEGGLSFGNVQNNAIGPKAGVGFFFNILDIAYLEPTIDVGYYLHNPRTDYLMNTEGEIVNVTTSAGAFGGMFDRYQNIKLKEVDGILNAGESIPDFLPSVNLGMKIGTWIYGFEFFGQYNHINFLSPYFDAMTDEIGDTPTANALNMASVGVMVPFHRRERVVRTTTRGPGRADFSNLSSEEARRIADASNGMLIYRDSRGLRFNPLAENVEFRDHYINRRDSVATTVARVPNSKFTMGYTTVDRMNIQASGQREVVIYPFEIGINEVTVKEYRIFLESMGVDIRNQDGIAAARVDTLAGVRPEQRMSWEELKQKAGLDSFPDGYNNPPNLSDVSYLMPDRSVWVEDGLHDLIRYETYFFSNEFLEYPVVAVNWYQAALFAAWADMRLPSEAEWEFAAKSGISGRFFPWDGESAMRQDGSFRANFRQADGIYDEDGHLIMAPVGSFSANDFGLYDMAGNVSEWVQDSWSPAYSMLGGDEQAFSFVSPTYNNIREIRKIHRGGSWKSSEFFIGSGVRNFSNKHRASTAIGFRIARSAEQSIR